MNIELTPERSGPCRVWDQPRPKVDYIIGADVAEGKLRDRGIVRRKEVEISYDDRRRDYSAACVLELKSGLHVASWLGHCDTQSFGNVLAALGYYYNAALLIPELNGPGIAVIQYLSKQLNYPNIYRNKNPQVIEGSPIRDELGWRTTVLSRPLLMDGIHQALNDNGVLTRDEILLDQMRTMQVDPNGQPRAMGIDKDDLVFAYALALRGRLEQLMNRRKPEDTPEDQRLPPDDRRVWSIIHTQQEALERARNRTGRMRIPSLMRRLSRTRRRRAISRR